MVGEDQEEKDKGYKPELADIDQKEYKEGLITALLSLLAISVFFFLDIGLREILSFNLESLLSYNLLLLLLFPLPFAYASSISLKGFRRSSAASAITLIFAMFDLKFLLLSLTLFLGTLISSYQSKNVFNGKNQAWTVYKSTSYAILIFGLIASSLFIYSYNNDMQFRDEAQGALADRAESTFSSFMPGAGDIAEKYTKGLQEIPDKTVTATKGIVLQRMQESGEFNSIQYQIVNNGFEEARSRIENQSTNQTQRIQEEVKERSDIDFKPIVKSMLEPSPMINSVMFLMILLLATIIKFPFGAISALYGKIMLKLK